MKNNYQERYLAHQKRKKEMLAGKYEKELTYTLKEKETFEKILKNRHSSRVFSGEKLTQKEIDTIERLAKLCPSSCDRQGVQLRWVADRDLKDLLSGILVGGVGWVNRADQIVLLMADMDAYGSPFERDFMPYLDGGVLIQNIYLICEVMGLKCCYVNPNIRELNKEFFKQRFGDYKFCGAIAIGK
jgi:nitroreductase